MHMVGLEYLWRAFYCVYDVLSITREVDTKWLLTTTQPAKALLLADGLRRGASRQEFRNLIFFPAWRLPYLTHELNGLNPKRVSRSVARNHDWIPAPCKHLVPLVQGFVSIYYHWYKGKEILNPSLNDCRKASISWGSQVIWILQSSVLLKCACMTSSTFAGPNPISSAFEYQRNRKELEADARCFEGMPSLSVYECKCVYICIYISTHTHYFIVYTYIYTHTMTHTHTRSAPVWLRIQWTQGITYRWFQFAEFIFWETISWPITYHQFHLTYFGLCDTHITPPTPLFPPPYLMLLRYGQQMYFCDDRQLEKCKLE